MIPEEAYRFKRGEEQVMVNAQTRAVDINQGIKDGYLQVKQDKNGMYAEAKMNNGIWVPFLGSTFPYKTWPQSEALYAANMIKALLIESLRLFKWYIPFVNKQKALDAFNRIAFNMFSSFMLKDEALTRFSISLKDFLYTFMVEAGFTEESSEQFALIFTHLIEYDNSYRMRLGDIFTETTKEKLKSRREIIRLLNLARNRETRPGGKGEAVHAKFRLFGFILYFALFLPKVRRAYLKALETLDLKALQFDDNDFFWSAKRSEYLYRGLTQEERLAECKNRGWTNPLTAGRMINV